MNDKKNIKAIVIIIIAIILVIASLIFGIAYSKYKNNIAQGTATVDVAKMICYMDVDSSAAEKTVINPYCDITVKDFNVSGGTTEVTETDVQYTITVTALNDENNQPFVLPPYHWENAQGTIIARSAPVTGTFTHSQQATHTYRIVFQNDGTEDIIRYVRFDLTAVQAPRPE